MISEALARGELEPKAGVGEPLPELTNDPGWWIRAFMEREELPEKQAELDRSVQHRLASATDAEELAEARSILATVNGDIRRWNRDVPAEFRMEEHSEVWLISERARRPA